MGIRSAILDSGHSDSEAGCGCYALLALAATTPNLTNSYPTPACLNLPRPTLFASECTCSIKVIGMGVIPFFIRMVRLVVAYNQAYRFKYARFVKWTPLVRVWAVAGTGLATRGVLFFESKPEHYSRYSSKHDSVLKKPRITDQGLVFCLELRRREERCMIGWFSILRSVIWSV